MVKRRTIENITQVISWMDEGITPKECAARYEEMFGEQFRPEAFTMLFKRVRGYSPVQRRDGSTPLIPWKLRVEHQGDWVPGVLRDEARRQRGLPVPPKREAARDSFLGYLRRNNRVVDYQPDTEKVFLFVPKRAGEDLVRMPKTTR